MMGFLFVILYLMWNWRMYFPDWGRKFLSTRFIFGNDKDESTGCLSWPEVSICSIFLEVPRKMCTSRHRTTYLHLPLRIMALWSPHLSFTWKVIRRISYDHRFSVWYICRPVKMRRCLIDLTLPDNIRKLSSNMSFIHVVTWSQIG